MCQYFFGNISLDIIPLLHQLKYRSFPTSHHPVQVPREAAGIEQKHPEKAHNLTTSKNLTTSNGDSEKGVASLIVLPLAGVRDVGDEIAAVALDVLVGDGVGGGHADGKRDADGFFRPLEEG